MTESLAGIAATGDRVATLEALRDRIADEIDKTASARDVAALSKQLTDVLGLIKEEAPPEEVDPLAALIGPLGGTG